MKVEIIEAEACAEHVHMLVSTPPYMGVVRFVGILKSKSALMIFDRHANLKYRYGSRNFWDRGNFVDTVGKNEIMIADYIKNQLEEDFATIPDGTGLILHSDQGWQYQHKKYQQMLEQKGIIQSISNRRANFCICRTLSPWNTSRMN